jgi:aminoglycoside phosphotransferase (APT) family kinase protein
LSTLGHPLADLAYACIRFHMSPEAYDGLMGLDLAALGLPTEAEFIAAYAQAAGRPAAITPFHLAFSLFRIAVIIEGVMARAMAGNASNDKAMQMAPMGFKLAERGWEIARG